MSVKSHPERKEKNHKKDASKSAPFIGGPKWLPFILIIHLVLSVFHPVSFLDKDIEGAFAASNFKCHFYHIDWTADSKCSI